MKRIIDTTLLVLVKDNKILLAQKKRGFGVGLFNGVGGKKQADETIYEAMLRETKEEINIEPIDAKLIGIIDFDLFLKGENVIEKMHIYMANDFIGTPTESDEMKPQWFDLDKIPYNNMFEDDIYWLPEALKGNKIKGICEFDRDLKLISKQFTIVENL